MPLPVLAGTGWWTDDSFVYLGRLGASVPPVAGGYLIAMDAFIEAVVAGAAAGVEEVAPSPDSACGPVWLIDPAYWWADPVAMSTSLRVREMQASGVSTPRRQSPVPLFRKEQGQPTLKQVLRWREDKSYLAPARANQFFTNLEGLVQQLVTVRGQLTITMRLVRDAAGIAVFPNEPAGEDLRWDIIEREYLAANEILIRPTDHEQ